MGQIASRDVLLIGNHRLLRAFLRAWMNRFDHLRVADEAGSAMRTLLLLERYRHALILMDFETLQSCDVDILTRIRVRFPLVSVIVYCGLTHEECAIKLIRAGAAGFVLKSAASEDMEEAIHTVLGGGVYLSPDFLKSLGTSVVRAGVLDRQGKALNPRLLEVLRLTSLGLAARAVAVRMNLGVKTVEAWRRGLEVRLKVRGVAGLMKYAIKAGLAPA